MPRRIARASSAWRRASQKVAPGSTRLARAVARYYFKLLAVKDEFEVARLYTDGSFQRQLAAEFEGDYRLYVHFAPPFTIPVIDWLTERRDPETGRMRKWRIPARWFLPALGLLAKFKFLRGTPLNLFGRTAHRRLEQQLCRDYEATLDHLLEGLGERNLDIAVEIASLPEHVRGLRAGARAPPHRKGAREAGGAARRLRSGEPRVSRTIFRNANLLDGDRPARAGVTVGGGGRPDHRASPAPVTRRSRPPANGIASSTSPAARSCRA